MQNYDSKTIQMRLKKERAVTIVFHFLKIKTKFNKSKILHNIVLKSSKFYGIFN